MPQDVFFFHSLREMPYGEKCEKYENKIRKCKMCEKVRNPNASLITTTNKHTKKSKFTSHANAFFKFRFRSNFRIF